MSLNETGRAGAGAAASGRLRADGVTLRYDDRTVSSDLTLTIPDGSFTAFVGPNACGKSTLLRALSRLLKPSSGTVVLDGHENPQCVERI